MGKKRDRGSIISSIIFQLLFILPTVWLIYQALHHSTYKRDTLIIILSAIFMYSLGFTKGLKSRDKEVIRLAKEADDLENRLNKLKSANE